MTQRGLWQVVVLGLVVGSAVTACGGDPKVAPQPGPATTASPTPTAWTRPDGVAILTKSSTGYTVRISDWNTGARVEDLPFQLTDGGFEPHVRSDLRYAARRNGYATIELYKPERDTGFVLAASLKDQAASFGGGKVELDEPRFNPATGRLWVTATPTKGDPYYLSVDPEQPTAKPRRESTRQAGLRPWEWGFDSKGALVETPDWSKKTITVAGSKGYAFKYATSKSGEIVYAGLMFTANPTYGRDAYQLLAELAPGDLLLRYVYPGANDDEGTVLRVSFDAKAKTVRYRTAIPASADRVVFQALAPDKSAVLVATTSAWYRVPLAGGGDQAEPLPAARSREIGEEVEVIS
ncbi:hypothetical protein ACFTSF_38025 [Kribbella sp. NPDC056951]|uniref:hypothetical protein n=1 Tax=Kribbella sp. NPDC056951 TaxID=3345978 RepID=UPI00363FE3CE